MSGKPFWLMQGLPFQGPYTMRILYGGLLIRIGHRGMSCYKYHMHPDTLCNSFATSSGPCLNHVRLVQPPVLVGFHVIPGTSRVCVLGPTLPKPTLNPPNPPAPQPPANRPAMEGISCFWGLGSLLGQRFDVSLSG